MPHLPTKCDDSDFFVYVKRTYSKTNRFSPAYFKVNMQAIRKK